MATIPDSVKAQLDSDWTGAGGAEPTYYVEEDIRTNPPTGQDFIFIMSSTLGTDAKPFNDKFVTDMSELTIITNTLTDEDRLKEIGDEVVRILDATAIAGVTYQRRKRRKIISGVDKGVFNYQEEIVYDLREQMKSGAAAYGAGATGVFITVGDLRVGGDDIQDSSGAVVISFDGAGAIDALAAPHALLTDTTLTGPQLEDLLMFGSANAAWVPCIYLTDNDGKIGSAFGEIQNIVGGGGAITYCSFEVPLPPLKGSLKLYISGIKFGIADADAGDYLTNYTIYGFVHDGRTNLRNITTDYTTPQEVEDTFGAVDCSSYDSIKVSVQIFSTNANDFDLNFLTMRCYYAA